MKLYIVNFAISESEKSYTYTDKFVRQISTDTDKTHIKNRLILYGNKLIWYNVFRCSLLIVLRDYMI